MKAKPYIITLCSKCKAEFESTGENHIRRLKPNQKYKEKCTYCDVRNGYDYKIIPRTKEKTK